MTGSVTSTIDGPYPGARPFGEVDHDRFFGRAGEAAVLADLWTTNRLTVMDGPVAAGKTSLIQAGVLPLVRERCDVLPPGKLAGEKTLPVAVFPGHNPYTLALLQSWEPGQAVAHLVGLTVAEFVKRRARQHDRTILAVIDQAEEVLADSGLRWSYRRRFLDELNEAVRTHSRFHVLLVVREDAAGQFPDVLDDTARFHLKPLTPAAALQAVTQPLEGTGRKYEPEAAEALVDEIRISRTTVTGGGERDAVDAFVEPSLLQVACCQLWQSLPPGGPVITARDVRRHGQVDAALARYCGQIVASVADDHELTAARLRSLLLRTFVTELGTRGTTYERPVDPVSGVPNSALRALQDRHLLAAERRSGSRWFELLNDRLIEPLRRAPDDEVPAMAAGDYLVAAKRALNLGDIDLAERYADITERVAPGTALRLHAEAESLLGNLAYECDEFRVAERHYRRAAELFEAAGDSTSVAHHLAALGQVLLAQERFPEAADQMRAAVERLPNDPVMQTDLGRALWQVGQSQTAAEVLTTVLAVDGGNSEALRTRGEILAYLGQPRNALLDLDRVNLRHRPSTRAARGLALAELGDYSAASQEIKDALTEAPRNGPVLLYAARATALEGDKAAAKELAIRAVEASDPSLPPQQRRSTIELLGVDLDGG
jgi:tetratricopeptide (TPR) repeat protein